MLRKSRWLFVPAMLVSLGGSVFAESRFTSWFSSECDYEPGSRKKYHSGREWPIAPRPDGPCEPYVQQYHTAHYWPDPYRWEDRASVRSHFAAQRNLGWISATTLYEQHFDPTTNDLNIAGRQHLRWILLHAPPSRRMTWVQSGYTQEISNSRLASVQQEASRITSNSPPIMMRATLPIGTSAEEMDLIRRSYLENIPKPRIPVSVTGGSTGTGGSNSSGNSPQSSQGQ